LAADTGLDVDRRIGQLDVSPAACDAGDPLLLRSIMERSDGAENVMPELNVDRLHNSEVMEALGARLGKVNDHSVLEPGLT